MKYKEIIDLTKNRVDEYDSSDTQVDTIVKNAINHSYMFDITVKEPRVTMTYVPVINGIATLPDDINKILSITPELSHKERRIGNVILSNYAGTYTIIYSTVPTPLVADEDVPQVSEKYHYSMSTYACYEYFISKKKTALAQQFYSTYQQELNKLDDNDDTGEEVVYDSVGDK
jgi:hypothetical protein